LTNHPDPIDVEVGARIRARRSAIGMSQAHVAEAIGVTFQQVQKYERGTNRVSASMLVKIAKVLEAPAASLLGEEEDIPQRTEMFQSLGVTGALKLVTAYAHISDPEVRSSLVRLAQTLAD